MAVFHINVIQFTVDLTATCSIIATALAAVDFQVSVIFCWSVDLLPYFNYYNNIHNRDL